MPSLQITTSTTPAFKILLGYKTRISHVCDMPTNTKDVQPRREHRDSPHTPQCRTGCRRPARAAGYRHRHATYDVLPMPALRRPNDRDRGVRARLRAEVAPDAEQDRHVMSQTSRERCYFPVPAGSAPAAIPL